MEIKMMMIITRPLSYLIKESELKLITHHSSLAEVNKTWIYIYNAMRLHGVMLS
jgi:hypothetical protein